MHASKLFTMLLPTAEGWQWWEKVDSHIALAQAKPPQFLEVYALPARALLLDVVEVPALEKPELEQLLHYRWQALDAEIEPHAQGSAWWALREIDGTQIVASLGLVGNYPHLPQLSHFTPKSIVPSFEIYPRPSNSLCVWQEFSDWVACFTYEDRVLFSGIFHTGELDSNAVYELQRLERKLEVTLKIGPNYELLAFSKLPVSFLAMWNRLSVLSWRELDFSPCLPKTEAISLFPKSISERIQQKAKRRRLLSILSAVATVYMGVFLAWWIYLQHATEQVLKREAWVDEMQPMVSEIQHIQLKREIIDPLINSKKYPIFTYLQLIQLLPAEGVRILDFEVSDHSLLIRGETSSVNTALQFKSDLQQHPEFAHFTWSFPQPKILPDNRATFEVEGKTDKL